MSQKMQEAVREYERIKQLFQRGDPHADEEWQKFYHADNGWSLAAEIVMHPKQYRI